MSEGEGKPSPFSFVRHFQPLPFNEVPRRVVDDFIVTRSDWPRGWYSAYVGEGNKLLLYARNRPGQWFLSKELCSPTTTHRPA